MKGEDPFQHRLERQPQRAIPAAWREEILNAAHDAASSHQAVTTSAPLFSCLKPWLSALLWPHPKAWAGLGLIWLLVFSLNLATQDSSGSAVVRQAAPISPQMRELLLQQEQLVAELAGFSAESKTSPARPVTSQPRSQRREETASA
jgi:hypothetical protein